MAREARYKELTRICEEKQIENLLVAHHADDQIETFFLRLAAESGLDGTTQSFFGDDGF